MGTFKIKLQVISMMLLFTFASAQIASALAKDGEASVEEGSTVSISLADVYVRTLKKSTGITYRWYSENNSYVTVTSFTRDKATIKGIKATSSCRVYFYCSYFIDGFYRTMDFYYTITVKSKNVSVTGISLSRSSANVKEGNTLQLTATAYPTNATNRNVNWLSSDASVASVSNGLVSAKSAGTATITCHAADGSGKYATCRVTVESSMVYVSNISLDRTSVSLDIGETVQLIASVSPSTASDKSVSWTSDNTSVAMVSSNGLVSAKSAGNATITCRANDGSGKSAICTIVCRATVPELVISDKDGLTDIPSVANVRYERSFYEGWNSVCLPFAFDAKLLGLQGAKIVLLSDWETVGNRQYIFYQVVEYVDAGCPCLVYLPSDQTCKITLEEVVLVDKPIKNGLLLGSFTETTIGSCCYKLTSDGKSFAATKTESAVCKPFRAYVKK